MCFAACVQDNNEEYVKFPQQIILLQNISSSGRFICMFFKPLSFLVKLCDDEPYCIVVLWWLNVVP